VILGAGKLTHCRFRLSTIGHGGTSASCSELSIRAGHMNQPHEATTSSHEPAQLFQIFLHPMSTLL
jgi:hypothetical protein